MGSDYPTIKKWLELLKTLGYVKEAKQGKRVMYFPFDFKPCLKPYTQACRKSDHQRVGNHTGGVSGFSPRTNPINQPKELTAAAASNGSLPAAAETPEAKKAHQDFIALRNSLR